MERFELAAAAVREAGAALRQSRLKSSDIEVKTGYHDLVTYWDRRTERLLRGRILSAFPGDAIVGYVSRGRGVSVHRADCPNVKSMEPERLIDAVWDTGADSSFNATLYITAENSGNMLASITAYIAAAKMPITGANVRVDPREHLADITIGVMIKNTEDLEELVRKIKSIQGVLDVRR